MLFSHFLLPGHLQLHIKCFHDNDSVILNYFHHFFPLSLGGMNIPINNIQVFPKKSQRVPTMSSHGSGKCRRGAGRFWWRLAVVASGLCCCRVLAMFAMEQTTSTSRSKIKHEGITYQSKSIAYQSNIFFDFGMIQISMFFSSSICSTNVCFFFPHFPHR